MNYVHLIAITLLGATLVPAAAAADTCVENALCVRQTQGSWGEGSCDEPSGWYGQHNDLRIWSPEVPYAHAWTYSGCAGMDDGQNEGKFSWLYANVMVQDPFGQVLLYGNAGWSTYEFNGEGACYVSYFTWDIFFGGAGWGRNCSVGPVHAHPPVGLLP